MKQSNENIIRKMFNKLGEEIMDEEIRIKIDDLNMRKNGYNRQKINKLTRIYNEIKSQFQK
jgi:hypothetical protein